MKKVFLTFLISLNFIAYAQTYVDPNTNEIFVWDINIDKLTYVAANQTPIYLNIIKNDKNPFLFFVKFPNDTVNYSIEILGETINKKSASKKTQTFYVASNSTNAKPKIVDLYKEAFEGYFVNIYTEEVLVIKKNNDKYEAKCAFDLDWKNLYFKGFSKSSFGLEFTDQNNISSIFSKTIKTDVLGNNDGLNRTNNSSVTKYIQIDNNTKIDKNIFENKTPSEIQELYRIYFQENRDINLKPVIYFYPKKNQSIQVKMQNTDNLIFTYPKLNKSWNFIANPDGKLIFENKKEYNYLFWEGNTKTTDLENNEGFIVEKENLTSFFEEKLTQMGLKPHEFNDFIVFWVPKMQKNETNWVSFAISSNDFSNENGKNLNSQYPLEITPKPETLFRVTLLYKSCSKDLKINNQKLSAFKRKGFTVVEWGGIELESENI